VAAGKVFWPQAVITGVAAIVGGYAGARVGRRLAPGYVRLVINIVNVAMTAVFFWRLFAR